MATPHGGRTWGEWPGSHVAPCEGAKRLWIEGAEIYVTAVEPAYHCACVLVGVGRDSPRPREGENHGWSPREVGTPLSAADRMKRVTVA